MDYEKEFEEFVKAYEKSGYLPENLISPKYARLIVSSNKILDLKEVDGLEIKTKFENGTLFADIKVKDNVEIKYPVHFCFGVLEREWTQKINVNFEVGKNSKIRLISHCFFPNSENVKHIMDGNFVLKEGSELYYEEEHFHGKNGAYVEPKIKIKVGKDARYISDFKTKKGIIGELNIDYEGILDENAVAELYAKVHGRSNDVIKIYESLILEGNNSKGLLKSRVAASDNSICEVKSVIKGVGDYSTGHVDCTEIIDGNGKVSAIPIVEVQNKLSRVTHEASLGRINKKQLEALMIKGLTEEEATEVIINGMLR